MYVKMSTLTGKQGNVNYKKHCFVCSRRAKMKEGDDVKGRNRSFQMLLVDGSFVCLEGNLVIT